MNALKIAISLSFSLYVLSCVFPVNNPTPLASHALFLCFLLKEQKLYAHYKETTSRQNESMLISNKTTRLGQV